MEWGGKEEIDFGRAEVQGLLPGGCEHKKQTHAQNHHRQVGFGQAGHLRHARPPAQEKSRHHRRSEYERNHAGREQDQERPPKGPRARNIRRRAPLAESTISLSSAGDIFSVSVVRLLFIRCQTSPPIETCDGL